MQIKYSRLQDGSGVARAVISLQTAHHLQVVKYDWRVCSKCPSGDNGNMSCPFRIAVDYTVDDGQWYSDTTRATADTRHCPSLDFCPYYYKRTK